MGKNWRVSAALSGAAAAWLTLAVIGLVGSLVKFAAEVAPPHTRRGRTRRST